MRVTIPDALADVYQHFADAQGRPLDAVLTAQLDRFQHCPPGERTVAVNVAAVEAALGGTPVRDGLDLIKRIGDLAGVTFHGIRLDFSPNQLEELARRAAREERPVEDVVAEIIKAINQQFFWGVGDAPTT